MLVRYVTLLHCQIVCIYVASDSEADVLEFAGDLDGDDGDFHIVNGRDNDDDELNDDDDEFDEDDDGCIDLTQSANASSTNERFDEKGYYSEYEDSDTDVYDMTQPNQNEKKTKQKHAKERQAAYRHCQILLQECR